MKPRTCLFRFRIFPLTIFAIVHSRKKFTPSSQASSACCTYWLHAVNSLYSPIIITSCSCCHQLDLTPTWIIILYTRRSVWNFTVEYIPGKLNTLDDFLTRGAAPRNNSFPARRRSVLNVPRITEEHPELPKFEIISKAQAMEPPPEDSGIFLTLLVVGDLRKNEDENIFVPNSDKEPQLRICVAAHCGFGCDRGLTVTTRIIKISTLEHSKRRCQCFCSRLPCLYVFFKCKQGLSASRAASSFISSF